jgi:hypothetical protein
MVTVYGYVVVTKVLLSSFINSIVDKAVEPQGGWQFEFILPLLPTMRPNIENNSSLS